MRTKILTKKRPFKSIQKARDDEIARILYADDNDLSQKEAVIRNILRSIGLEGRELYKCFQQLRKLDFVLLRKILTKMGGVF